MSKEFDHLFKALNIVEDELKKEILNVGVLEQVPKPSFIVEQHKYIKWLALVKYAFGKKMKTEKFCFIMFDQYRPV